MKALILKENRCFENLSLSLVLIFLILLSFLEITLAFFILPKPMYWRPWEEAANLEGKDHNYIPFKPFYRYERLSAGGDLTHMGNYKPYLSEIRFRKFYTDEYGFRNRVGMLKNPIEAVILGSSFVAGAQETQENLVSEILTDKYNIPTYNEATYIVGDFLEDSRFIAKPPKYLILLGNEGELITSHFRYAITNRKTIKGDPLVNDVRAWKSYNEWKTNNNPFKYTFSNVLDYLKNISVARYFANKIYVEAINFGRNRYEVSKASTRKEITYEDGMLFWQADYDVPILGSIGKTNEDIAKAIETLQAAREFLSKKGITIIVAAMPSKTHLELNKYKNLTDAKRALLSFEKALNDADIEHVKLYSPSIDFMQKTGEHLYYPDDGHWNADANKLIAELLAKKINELNSKRP